MKNKIKHPVGNSKIFLIKLFENFISKVILFFLAFIIKINKAESEIIISNVFFAPWKADRLFFNFFIKVKKYTLLDVKRAYTLWYLSSSLKNIKGAILDVGCLQGGAGFLMSKANKKGTTFLIDSFEGIVELSEENFRDLQQFSEEHNVEFFASPWDEESLDFLLELNLNILKIPSVEITNYEFLEKFSKTNLPIILSTGTALMKDIDKALEILSKGNSDIMILQCTSAYPSKFDEIDLNVIKTFIKKYDNVIGYSGHEPGVHIPIAAVSMGARLVEKHVTLNKKMNGTDHAASIDMDELEEMVKCIREVEVAFGSSEKRKFESENSLINVLGKSLVTTQDIKSGAVIDESMLTTKGPFEGIPASEYYNVIGKKLKNEKKADQILFIEDFD